MPRRPNLDRPVKLTLSLPETWRAKLDLMLFSELEGRVPKGKYQEFFMERLQEFFGSRSLNLEPYGFPAGFVIRGNKDIIDNLEKKFQSWQALTP